MRWGFVPNPTPFFLQRKKEAKIFNASTLTARRPRNTDFLFWNLNYWNLGF
jgi:hypothetical protein